VHIYNAETARHYDAYRPPLHQIILQRALGERHFDHGLDVGCGTGSSSVAISGFCNRVTAIDPSDQMLRRANRHPSISYSVFDGSHIPGESSRFEIITFAGSLFYTDRMQMLGEVCRVAKSRGQVLIYDFNILLDDVLEYLGIAERASDSYRHNINFNELKSRCLQRIKGGKSLVTFQLTIEELAHLVLADEWYFHQLGQMFNGYLHAQLVRPLSAFRPGNEIECWAQTYFTLYEVKSHQNE